MTPAPLFKAQQGYAPGYHPMLIEALRGRRATHEAAFFVPHLRPGMRLLDCGCGPGSLTVDLAEIVAPGQAVGIDLEPRQFEYGRAQARRRGVSNISFQQGNVASLEFENGTFDAVFVHALLYHLSDPREALREVYRVLKPGGVVGLRDADRGGDICTPTNDRIEFGWSLIERVLRYHGADLYFGRTQRALLRDTGFLRTQGSASYDCFGTPEATRGFAAFWVHFFDRLHADLIVRNGWATRAAIKDICSAFADWGRSPDAFFARARCEAVAWK